MTNDPPGPPGSAKNEEMESPGMTVNRMSEAYAENDKTRESKHTATTPCDPVPRRIETPHDLLRNAYAKEPK